MIVNLLGVRDDHSREPGSDRHRFRVQSKPWAIVLPTAPRPWMARSRFFACMNSALPPMNVSFTLDNIFHFSEIAGAHREPDSMAHEPRGF